jgi:hypothetical protein
MSSEDLYATVADAALQVLRSVLEPKTAIYVAGPLETGRSFYESGVAGLPHAEQATIRRINQERLTRFVAELRATQPKPVIDPGLLRVPGWPNELYGRFFFAVIEEFVECASFLDEWEYSRGATSEYVHCVQLGITCYDERGNPIPIREARKLIEKTVRAVEALGHDPSRFQARLQALRSA